MRQTALIFALGFLVFASCKPKEETKIPTPVPTNDITPSSAVAQTNAKEESPSKVTLPSGVIAPEDAKNHIGETATVKGKVDRVYVSQKGDVFIDMGGKRPNAAFTAVCFKQAIPTVQLQDLDGKIISVKGKIKEYQGKVEIVLEKADQISQ